MQQEIEIRGFTRTFQSIVQELITECGVSMPFNPKSGGTQPQVIQTKGLWDTGATHSVITKELAAQLSLKPIKTTQSHHAGGTSTVNVYLINVYLPNNSGISYVQVSECIETIGRFGLLIGMDIISRGDFALSNPNGKTTMSFRMPSVQQISLEKDCMPAYTQVKKQINGKEVIDPKTSRNAQCPCNSGKKYKNCHGKT